MSKELEALEGMFDLIKSQGSFEKAQKYFDIIETALQRLEAIDNAEPSEALEDLIDMIEYFTRLDYVEPIVRNEIHDKFKDIYWHKLPHLDSIKQALLKAQQSKHYLKWEDLKFEHTPKYIDVKMNDNKYRLVVGYNVAGNNLVILRNDKQQYYFLEADKQFFNDLHLERVLE